MGSDSYSYQAESVSALGDTRDNEYLMSMSECLVVGPLGSGKTVLLKRLKCMCEEEQKQRKEANYKNKQRDEEWTIPVTQPTTGTTLVSLSPHNCILKEYGYSMVSLWNKAAQHTDAVIYVVDASNPQQISAAIVLLMELLADKTMTCKPVLVFYNKTDLPSTMSVPEMKEVMRVHDLIRTREKFVALSGSCATGEGIDKVSRWIKAQCVHKHIDTACK